MRLLVLLVTAASLHCLPAATLVVDGAAPNASDDNPGTEKKPLRTIQHAVGVAKAGDEILVLPARYGERVKLSNSGTADARIVVRSTPRRSAIVRGFDVDASYIHIEGFEITAEKPAVAVQLNASHCEVLDNFIHDMMVGVAGTVGQLSPDGQHRDYSQVSHNRIAYNKVYHSEYGFVLGGNDWLVENNEVERLFMFVEGKRFDDCDYTRFFGKGCTQRYNYYHGSTASEIRVAHVDCLQTFCVNGEIAQDLVFENNTCFDFHQMCMVESTPHIGSVSNWILRGNIVSANSPNMSGGWGPDIIQTQDVLIENNTISGVRWSCIGLRGKESTGARIINNILADAERAVIDGDSDFTHSEPLSEFNLTFKTWAAPGDKNLNGKDPLFMDPANRNFRLRPGSPAISAGKNGQTIGALHSPNVYYVDPHHPAASDEPAWGYPAVPLKTLHKACEIVQPGETIVLRGGTYRETLRPKHDRVTFRAMAGEKVVISSLDLCETWRRETDEAWSSAVSSKPSRLLCDGRRWADFRYDRKTRRIFVKGTDPRLHRFEVPSLRQPIELKGRTEIKLEGIAADR